MNIKQLFKNRLFIGVICILLALLSVFSGIKVMERQNEEISVVLIKKDIAKGTLITEDMLSSVTVGVKNTDNLIRDSTQVIGQYALTDFITDDFVMKNQIALNLPNLEKKLQNLDGSRVAISFNIKDFASGLSDKIVSGDIVSCIVTSEAGTTIPLELTYVEVLTTTAGSGIDKQASDELSEENLATATVLVTPQQASLLAEYDENASIHLALVFRGEQEKAQQFLTSQAEAIAPPEGEVEEKAPEETEG